MAKYSPKQGGAFFMAKTVSKVLQNTNNYSNAKYEMLRSDGRLPDRTKPKTPADQKIHISHIVDSSQYNLRHAHDHEEEMAFDFKRLSKEDPKLAKTYQKQIKDVLNPVFKKMKLRLN